MLKDAIYNQNDENLKLWIPLFEQRELMAEMRGMSEHTFDQIAGMEIMAKRATRMSYEDAAAQANSAWMMISFTDYKSPIDAVANDDAFAFACYAVWAGTNAYIEETYN